MSWIVTHSFQHRIPHWPHMTLQLLLCFCGPISGKTKQNKTRIASKIAVLSASKPLFPFSFEPVSSWRSSPPLHRDGAVSALLTSKAKLTVKPQVSTRVLDRVVLSRVSVHFWVFSSSKPLPSVSLTDFLYLCLSDTEKPQGRVSNLFLCLYSLTSWVNSPLRVLMSLIHECLWDWKLRSRFVSLAALLASPPGSVSTMSNVTPKTEF